MKRFDPEGLIRHSGLEEGSEAHDFFLLLLKNAIKRETDHEEALRRLGSRLVALADSGNVAAVRKIGAVMAQTERAAASVLPLGRGVLAAAKMYAVEYQRQSGNSERRQKTRNEQIKRRFKELTPSMSDRAAARKIRGEMKLQISTDRIRQIGTKKTG